MTNEEFLNTLRDALSHLYDPVYLRRSPLLRLLGFEEQQEASQALQRALIDIISAMEPDSDIPSTSRAWRIYELLFCRYVQQLGAAQVAAQLGISERHLRREQLAALEALAYRLRKQYELRNGNVVSMAKNRSPSANARVSPPVSEELAWLANVAHDQSTDIQQSLSAVLDLVRPLAEQYGTKIDTQIGADTPQLAVHPVAFNQILINVLSIAISWLTSSVAQVSAQHRDWQVEITVKGASFYTTPREFSDQERASLHLASQMVEMATGTLSTSIDGRAFKATVRLPALECVTVLVIDDNADTLKLFQHFVNGTRYKLKGTRNPDQVFELVTQYDPQIIILDVMMPQVDGWQLLGRLRQHPSTAETLIIVCTILGQEELAYSLGASAFVQKPLDQESLLDALDQQMAFLATRSD